MNVTIISKGFFNMLEDKEIEKAIAHEAKKGTQGLLAEKSLRKLIEIAVTPAEAIVKVVIEVTVTNCSVCDGSGIIKKLYVFNYSFWNQICRIILI